jgi:hypothetical protein
METYMSTHHHVAILAVNSSWSNPEILVVREVLTHICVTFYPCTRELHKGTVQC